MSDLNYTDNIVRIPVKLTSETIQLYCIFLQSIYNCRIGEEVFEYGFFELIHFLKLNDFANKHIIILIDYIIENYDNCWYKLCSLFKYASSRNSNLYDTESYQYFIERLCNQILIDVKHINEVCNKYKSRLPIKRDICVENKIYFFDWELIDFYNSARDLHHRNYKIFSSKIVKRLKTSFYKDKDEGEIFEEYTRMLLIISEANKAASCGNFHSRYISDSKFNFRAYYFLTYFYKILNIDTIEKIMSFLLKNEKY